MPNPALLLCDSDVLVQLFLADELRPLQDLRTGFAVQPAVVPEVDLELRWINNKYKDRFVPQLDKALRNRVLVKLDQALFQSLLGTATPGSSWSTYQALGAQYYGYTQRGEAYTYAAALSLGFPAASNDFRAIRTLHSQMMNLPAPILRSFDLVAFSYEYGGLNLRDCETFRSELLRHGEGLPHAFGHCSFEDGLKPFSCRLRVGSSVSPALAVASFDDPLFLIPQ